MLRTCALIIYLNVSTLPAFHTRWASQSTMHAVYLVCEIANTPAIKHMECSQSVLLVHGHLWLCGGSTRVVGVSECVCLRSMVVCMRELSRACL